jgi:hypothetical protein
MNILDVEQYQPEWVIDFQYVIILVFDYNIQKGAQI